MKTLGIIPARMASERLPGKPLADIAGKPMIQLVYEKVEQSGLDHCIITTPDEEIKQAAAAWGADIIMTSDQHESGTERCIEVLDYLSEDYDLVINIQGDEPLINPEQIDLLACNMQDADVATLYRKVAYSPEIENPNIVKLVSKHDGLALYFSRAPIPYSRDPEACTYYKLHVGMYAYTPAALSTISKLSPGELEQTEKLEQLRWLENGLSIKCIETHHENHGVDTAEDLEKIRSFFIKEK